MYSARLTSLAVFYSLNAIWYKLSYNNFFYVVGNNPFLCYYIWNSYFFKGISYYFILIGFIHPVPFFSFESLFRGEVDSFIAVFIVTWKLISRLIFFGANMFASFCFWFTALQDIFIVGLVPSLSLFWALWFHNIFALCNSFSYLALQLPWLEQTTSLHLYNLFLFSSFFFTDSSCSFSAHLFIWLYLSHW